MQDLLRFDVPTIPGQVAYQKASKEMAILFVLSVMTEGYKEEPKYLKSVQELINDSDTANIVVHIVNRHYIHQKDAAGHSNPLKRLEALKQWKENHSQIEGFDNKDEYWLICDRDDSSFTSQQYDDVILECQKEGIHLIVSNPAFQVWLLLHFTADLQQYKLEQYESSSQCVKNAIEPAIRSYDAQYKHGNINMKIYKPLMRDAIRNSVGYSHDVQDLKCRIGTNFRSLLLRIEEVVGKSLFW